MEAHLLVGLVVRPAFFKRKWILLLEVNISIITRSVSSVILTEKWVENSFLNEQ